MRSKLAVDRRHRTSRDSCGREKRSRISCYWFYTSRSLPALAGDAEAGQGEAGGHGEGQAVSLAGRWGEGGTFRVQALRGLLCEREREREADRLKSFSLC